MSTTGNPPCVKNCGFFGSPATSNMCSSCYKKHLATQPQSPPPHAEASMPAAPPAPPAAPASPPPAAPSPSVVSLASPVAAVVAAAAAAPASPPAPPRREQRNRRRCFKCNKKVGLLGFDCVCERTFCSEHRHAEQHECDFDFRARQREQLAKDNPTVKASKVNRL